MDVNTSRVRLVDPDSHDEPGAMKLCVVHADRLTVPAGWQVEDARTGTTAGLAGLFGGDTAVDELPTPGGRLLRRAFGNALPD